MRFDMLNTLSKRFWPPIRTPSVRLDGSSLGPRADAVAQDRVEQVPRDLPAVRREVELRLVAEVINQMGEFGRRLIDPLLALSFPVDKWVTEVALSTHL